MAICNDNGAKDALKIIQNKLKIPNPDNHCELCQVGAIEYPEQDGKTFLDNFGTSGRMTVGDAQSIVCLIDTDKEPDPDLPGNIGGGCIEVESRLDDVLIFESTGGFVIQNSGQTDFDPENMWFALVRGNGLSAQELIGENYTTIFPNQVDGKDGVRTTTIKEFSAFNIKNDGVTGLSDDQVVFLLEDDSGSLIGIGKSNTIPESTVIAPSTGDTETVDIGTTPVVNIGLAKADLAIISMFRNSLDARLSDVKGNSDDPFIAVLGGHIHQNALSGIRYSGDVYGVSCGADKFVQLKSGNYLRIGGALGYAHGSIDFHGPAVPAA